MKNIFPTIFLLMTGINHSISQELKLNLLTDESYYHNNITHVKMSQEIQEEFLITDVIYGGKMRFTVQERTDSLYRLEVQFQTLHFTTNFNDIKISADTEKTDSLNVFDLVLKEMIKSPFEAEITEYGIVKNVEMKKVFDNLLNLDLNMSQLDKAQAIFTLQQTFGEKAMKGSIEMFTAIYPKGPVKVGDIWNNSIRLETISGITMNNQFELLNRDQNTTTIKINSETVSDKEDSFSEMNGAFYRISSIGKMEATYIVDSLTGWIKECQIVQQIAGLNERKWREDSAIIIKTPFTYEGLIHLYSN